MKRGFTLLEVIIALAMLAVIAVPAIGLATMAVSRSRDLIVTGNATELKNRIDIALRSYSDETDDVFTESFPKGNGFAFIASQSLEYIELEDSVTTAVNDGYYRVDVIEAGNAYNANTDSYRVLTYTVTWPNNNLEQDQQQLFFVSVFRR